MIQNPEVKFKQMSLDHREGRLSLEDLNKECSYWYLETFETFSPRQDPSPPLEYLDYKQMSFEKRVKVSSEFFKTEAIKNYLDFRDKVRSENFAHTNRLKEFIEYLPIEDLVSRAKYQEKLTDFTSKDYL